MHNQQCQYCGQDTYNVDIDYLVGVDHLSCALEAELKTKENKYDHCILCGVETIYEKSTHVDMRLGYIEGAGQLCSACWDRGTNHNMLAIPEWLIENNPNDQILGSKVRELYFESKK